MSAVDVLAVLDGWATLIAHTSGNPNAPDDLREARAAVAELVEADRGYDVAMANLKFATEMGKADALDVTKFRVAVATERRDAALARIGGAK